MTDARQRIVFAVEANCASSFPVSKRSSECCGEMKMPFHPETLLLQVIRQSIMRLFLLVGQLGVLPDVK